MRHEVNFGDAIGNVNGFTHMNQSVMCFLSRIVTVSSMTAHMQYGPNYGGRTRLVLYCIRLDRMYAISK